MTEPTGEPAKGDDGSIGCRPIVEALGIFAALFVVGVLVLFGADPDSVGPIRAFVFFLGAPATAVLQFLSPEGFALAWPIDVLVWVLAAVWVARTHDRQAWRRRLGVVLGAAAVVALVAALPS